MGQIKARTGFSRLNAGDGGPVDAHLGGERLLTQVSRLSAGAHPVGQEGTPLSRVSEARTKNKACLADTSSPAAKKAIGDRLAELRVKKDMKQDAVSKCVGLAPRGMGNYESGRTVPSAQILANLAVLYGASINWILGIPEGSRTTDQEAPVIDPHLSQRIQDPDWTWDGREFREDQRTALGGIGAWIANQSDHNLLMRAMALVLTLGPAPGGASVESASGVQTPHRPAGSDPLGENTSASAPSAMAEAARLRRLPEGGTGDGGEKAPLPSQSLSEQDLEQTPGLDDEGRRDCSV